LEESKTKNTILASSLSIGEPLNLVRAGSICPVLKYMLSLGSFEKLYWNLIGNTRTQVKISSEIWKYNHANILNFGIHCEHLEIQI
jgi:hypothetical protein